jgi:hypothetical protein
MAKKTEETVEVREADATQVAPKVEIIRGRMPAAVVALIRYKEEGVATAAIAAKYRTTVGKVDDIKKGRNFGYITDEFKPTPEQVADAKGYIEQLIGDNAVEVAGKLEALGVAEDGGAAFEAARIAARKSKAPATAPVDTEVAAPVEGGDPVDEVEDTDLSEFTD